MTLRIRTAIVGLGLLFVGLAAAQTVEEILANNQKAEGAGAKAKFTSIVIKGKMEMLAQDMEIPMTVTYKRPNMHRTDMEMMGKTMTRATDGKEYWLLMPAMMGSGKATVKTMDTDETTEFQHHSTIDGILHDYKQYEMTASLVGKTTRDSNEVYKVVLKDKAGKEQSYYIDTKTNLLYQSEQTVKGREGNDVKMLMTFSDFRDVSGAKFPFKMIQKVGAMEIVISYESIEVNSDIDDSIFKKSSADTK